MVYWRNKNNFWWWRLNRDDAIVIETFSSRAVAELAAGLLEAEGIETLVLADDAGGAYPMLQFVRGVRVLVAVADEARAREILSSQESEVSEQ
ncbi:MAG: DUF2007 domain-containing protein [Deltaproteobacteria bacterium]|nr:DUF2007 domain-containing protein [Deltaproteobacteria bacterium]